MAYQTRHQIKQQLTWLAKAGHDQQIPGRGSSLPIFGQGCDRSLTGFKFSSKFRFFIQFGMWADPLRPHTLENTVENMIHIIGVEIKKQNRRRPTMTDLVYNTKNDHALGI